MKLSGHPTVKSQAFVGAEQQAKSGRGGLGSAAQDAYEEFMRNRNRPRIDTVEAQPFRARQYYGTGQSDQSYIR